MSIIYTNSRGTEFVDTSDAGSLSKRIASMEASADFQATADALPNPDDVLKNSGEKISVYKKLENDDQVSAAIGQLTDGIKSLSLDIVAKKVPKRIVKACELWLDKINIPNFIDQVIGAKLFGYQPMEALWSEWQGFSLPLQIDALPQEWFGFDKDGRLLFFSKDNQQGEPVEENNPHKFLVAKHGASYANPYGKAALGKCFWPVTFKKGGIKFWLYFTEKFGMPWVVIKVPPNTPDDVREELMRMGQRMVQDAVSVINDTDLLELKESASKGASADLYEKFLKYQDAAISKALVGQTATTEGTPNKLGNEETRGEVLSKGIWSAAAIVEETINTIFAWIAEVNFGSDRAPEAKFYERDEVQLSRAQRDQIFLSSGLPLTYRYFTEKYYIDENHLAVDDLDEPVKSATPEIPGTPPIDPEGRENPAPSPPPTPSDPEGAEEEFADAEGLPDQDAIDLMLDSFSDEDYQGSMEGLLNPVFSLINKSSNYAEVERKLAAQWPEMDTAKLQETIGRLMFFATITGRQEVAEETEEDK